MSLPLRIAFLWHQHQPYYRKNNSFILPWVRLHAAKDYYDLPALALEYPSIKQTINLVPSLLLQINEYLSEDIHDEVFNLTLIPAESLTKENKTAILKTMFLCNAETMIVPYTRYHELFMMASQSIQNAIDNFSTQDWLDIQTWYNLTWIGFISRRKIPDAEALFVKGKYFTENDKLRTLSLHKEIMASIIPIMKYGVEKKLLEISTTPMYHPILPLLIDSEVSREAMPDSILPEPVFKSVDDAQWQIQSALEYMNNTLQIAQKGMWPSEGSLSNQTIDLMVDNGVTWIATDEGILKASIADHHWTDIYFPRNVRGVTCYFRDHGLSDLIGFVYSRWDAQDAAEDMIHKFESIRSAIIEHHGEQALEHAVVPIILDGENCWEYYQDNGEHFLRSLYAGLTANPLLTTITMSEGISSNDYLTPIDSIRSGSWIHANFSIWIGHKEDRKAWEMLARARHALMNTTMDHTSSEWKRAYNHLMIAEGSDWFWWYGDEHSSENSDDFDDLFRWNIEQIYRYCTLSIPDEVLRPIKIIDIVNASDETVNRIVLFKGEYSGNTMHSSSECLESITIEKNSKLMQVLITVNLHNELEQEHDYIIVNVKANHAEQKHCILRIERTSLQFPAYKPISIHRELRSCSISLPLEFASGEIDVEVSNNYILTQYPNKKQPLLYTL